MERKLLAAAACFGYFFLVGLGLWVASPWITAAFEPGDAPYAFEAWWLIGFALLGGALLPKSIARYAVGLVWLPCVIGQFMGMMNQPKVDHGWWQLWLVSLSAKSIYAVIGFFGGMALGQIVRMLRERRR